MDLSVDRLPFPGSTISGTWVNRDGEMWRVDFALGKRVPLPCPLLLGASFHSIWCCYFFSPAWGLFWREAELGVNGNWQIFFFLCDMNTLPIPPSSGPVFALFLLLTSMRKQTGNFCAGWDSCTISSNSGLGSFWTFSHACTTHQVPHTCAKTVGSLKI